MNNKTEEIAQCEFEVVCKSNPGISQIFPSNIPRLCWTKIDRLMWGQVCANSQLPTGKMGRMPNYSPVHLPGSLFYLPCGDVIQGEKPDEFQGVLKVQGNHVHSLVHLVVGDCVLHCSGDIVRTPRPEKKQGEAGCHFREPHRQQQYSTKHLIQVRSNLQCLLSRCGKEGIVLGKNRGNSNITMTHFSPQGVFLYQEDGEMFTNEKNCIRI